MKEYYRNVCTICAMSVPGFHFEQMTPLPKVATCVFCKKKRARDMYRITVERRKDG